MWPFKKRAEQRAASDPQYRPGPWALAGGAPSLAGLAITTNNALAFSAMWACVSLIAGSVSTLPLDLYRAGSREPLPLPGVLTDPAAGWSGPEWREAVMRSLLLRGNAYGLVVARDATLRPSQIELLHPDLVSATYEDSRLVYRIRGRIVDSADIWHARAFTMPGQPTGLDPVGYAREALGLGLAAESYGALMFNQGSLLDGILETDHELTPEQAEALKLRWRDKVTGLVHAHEVAVLDSGAKFRPLQLTPEQALFIESRKFQAAEIARLFNVDPAMIGIEQTTSHTYSSPEQRNTEYVRFCLAPWLVRLETALGQLVPRGQYLKFNPNALLRATTLDRFTAYEKALAAGWMTVAEVRALEDLQPLEAAA